jgi:hypothetical protein
MTEHERDDAEIVAESESEPEIEPWPGQEPEADTGAAVPVPGIPGAVVTRPAAAAPSVSEIAVHIDDRVSAIFVLAVIAVFVGILLYGVVGGVGGALSQPATPAPSVPPVASASP